jgi:hypothetical protein
MNIDQELCYCVFLNNLFFLLVRYYVNMEARYLKEIL